MFRILIEDIAEFHKKFGLEYEGKPRPLPFDLYDFRYWFMVEEANEWKDAQKQMTLAVSGHPEIPLEPADVTHNMAKALDAIVDVLYITLGNAYLQGFNERHLSEAWSRVHEANMKKMRGESKRSALYDIVKPPGWVAPKLDDLVEDHIYNRTL